MNKKTLTIILVVVVVVLIAAAVIYGPDMVGLMMRMHKIPQH